MGDLIKLLPDSLANQIAAGEVVQRPASVVKELLENAVDAGATDIKLILKEAGKALIQVIDNGKGMSPVDARLCWERHATSKIKASEDLFNINTMGFRGEALASIAAVAQVEMRTRQPQDELATEIHIEGSTIIKQEACQSAPGTSFSVKNLFFNIPARRNFLKSNPIEMKHILDEFQRVAVAYPEIAFSLHHNGSALFALTKGNLRQRLTSVYGPQINKTLVPVNEETDLVAFHGFVCKPEGARKTRGEQMFFVNNRFIKSSYLHHAVQSAYEGLITAEHHPVYCIFIKVHPSKIDVNVHPTKQEIKFEDERIIYNYLKVSVRHAIGQYSLANTLDFDQESVIQNNPHGLPKMPNLKTEGDFYTASSKMSKDYDYQPPQKTEVERSNLKHWESLYDGLETIESKATSGNEQDEGGEIFSSKMSADESEMNEQKKPFQLHGKFVVTQIKSGILLIDQQAATERILFERFLKQHESRQATSQQLLFPIPIRFSVADAEILKEIIPELNAMGIDIRDFGNNSFVLHGMPPELDGISETQVLESLIEQYKHETDVKARGIEKIAWSMAKRASTPHGKELKVEAMQEIIDRLFACDVPYQAPFGKKTFISLEIDFLDNLFTST